MPGLTRNGAASLPRKTKIKNTNRILVDADARSNSRIAFSFQADLAIYFTALCRIGTYPVWPTIFCPSGPKQKSMKSLTDPFGLPAV